MAYPGVLLDAFIPVALECGNRLCMEFTCCLVAIANKVGVSNQVLVSMIGSLERREKYIRDHKDFFFTIDGHEGKYLTLEDALKVCSSLGIVDDTCQDDFSNVVAIFEKSLDGVVKSEPSEPAACSGLGHRVAAVVPAPEPAEHVAAVVPAPEPEFIDVPPGFPRRRKSLDLAKIDAAYVKTLPRAALEKLCLFAVSKWRSKESSVRRAHQRNRRTAADVKRVRKDLKNIRQSHSLFQGRRQRYLSGRGGFAVALRRTAANLAAGSLSIAIGVDVTRRQVTSHECRLRAAMLSACIEFHERNLAHMRLAPATSGFRLQAHLFRGDATNAAVWQRCKLRAQEVKSIYCVDAITNQDTLQSFLGKVEVHRCLCPLVPVRGSAGNDTFALIAHQADMVGVQQLRCRSMVPALGETEAAFLALPATEPARADSAMLMGGGADVSCVDPETSRVDPVPDDWDKIVSMMIFCSDGGSDEVHARKTVHRAFQRNPTTWIFDCDCFQHCYHIMVNGGLNCANKFLWDLAGLQYTNSLAKLMNVWRERAVTIYMAWAKNYGALAAQAAGRVPPAFISGRWGAVSRCERFVLASDLHQLQAVFATVFIEKAVKKAAKTKDGKPQPFREEMMDDYKARMSKWEKASMEAIACPHFFS